MPSSCSASEPSPLARGSSRAGVPQPRRRSAAVRSRAKAVGCCHASRGVRAPIPRGPAREAPRSGRLPIYAINGARRAAFVDLEESSRSASSRSLGTDRGPVAGSLYSGARLGRQARGPRGRPAITATGRVAPGSHRTRHHRGEPAGPAPRRLQHAAMRLPHSAGKCRAGRKVACALNRVVGIKSAPRGKR